MDTLVGKLPLAYPSVCTSPPGKDLSAFQHLHMTKICSIRHDVLRRAAVIIFSISAIICVGCNFTPRSFNTALMSHRFRPHLQEKRKFRWRSLQISHSFFSTGTLLLPAKWIKYILETLLKLNSKQIWMFYGWSWSMSCYCGILDLHAPPFLINTLPIRQTAGWSSTMQQGTSKSEILHQL